MKNKLLTVAVALALPLAGCAGLATSAPPSSSSSVPAPAGPSLPAKVEITTKQALATANTAYTALGELLIIGINNGTIKGNLKVQLLALSDKINNALEIGDAAAAMTQIDTFQKLLKGK